MYEDYCLDMEETRFCFEISKIAQVPSFGDQLPTWLVAQLAEHRTSKPKVAGSNPSRAKWIFLCLSGMVRHLEKHLITKYVIFMQ